MDRTDGNGYKNALLTFRVDDSDGIREGVAQAIQDFDSELRKMCEKKEEVGLKLNAISTIKTEGEQMVWKVSYKGPPLQALRFLSDLRDNFEANDIAYRETRKQ